MRLEKRGGVGHARNPNSRDPSVLLIAALFTSAAGAVVIKGQIVGFYGEGSPAPMMVKEGEIVKNVNFTVILFPGRGPFSEDR